MKKTWDEIYSENDMKNLPWLNPELVMKERIYLQSYLQPGILAQKGFALKILDYACGTGEISRFLANGGNMVAVADVSEAALSKAGTGYDKRVKASRPSDVKSRSKYNLIACIGLFHHLHPLLQIEFLKEFKGLLDQKGVLVIMGHDDEDGVLKQGARPGEKHEGPCDNAGCPNWPPKGCHIQREDYAQNSCGAVLSRFTGEPVYSINHLEMVVHDAGWKIIDSRPIEYFDDIVFNIDRQFRAYAMMHRRSKKQ